MSYLVIGLHDDTLVDGLLQQLVVVLPGTDIGTITYLFLQLAARHLLMTGHHVAYQPRQVDMPRAVILIDHILAVQTGPLGSAASLVEELFVAQELINKVKLKCCGI